jgi:hypothetical protein
LRDDVNPRNPTILPERAANQLSDKSQMSRIADA